MDSKVIAYLVGQIIAIILMLGFLIWGVFKCYQISKRETTCTKCVIGLMLIFCGLIPLLVNFFLHTRGIIIKPLFIIAAVVFFILMITGLIFAIRGLYELKKNPDLKQGKKQAVAAIIISLLIITANTFTLLKGKNTFEKYYSSGRKKEVITFAPNTHRHGKVIGYYETGEKQYEGEILNKLQHGRWTKWDKDGKILGEILFDKGIRLKECQYYSNGNKKLEIEFLNNKKHGKEIHYYKSGKKKVELNYIGGVKHGKEIHWHENGVKSLEAEFQNGHAHGKCLKWYESGRISAELFYKNGLKEGKYTEWYENGKTKTVIEFKNDKENGKIQK